MSLPYVNPSRRLITFGPYYIGAERLAHYKKIAKSEGKSLSAWMCLAGDARARISLPLPFGRGVPRKDIRFKLGWGCGHRIQKVKAVKTPAGKP